MLQFLQMGFSIGPDVIKLLQDDTVCTLLKAQKHLYNESHRFKQFLRFSVTGRVLTAVIKPMNQVLPLIAPHFSRPLSGRGFFNLRRIPRYGARPQAGRVGDCSGRFLCYGRPGRAGADVPRFMV